MLWGMFSLLKVAVSSMQGWRVSMEDAHTHLLALPGDPNAAFFAVFDGHGGSTIAHHVSHHLHKNIVQNPAYSKLSYTTIQIFSRLFSGFLL